MRYNLLRAGENPKILLRNLRGRRGARMLPSRSLLGSRTGPAIHNVHSKRPQRADDDDTDDILAIYHKSAFATNPHLKRRLKD